MFPGIPVASPATTRASNAKGHTLKRIWPFACACRQRKDGRSGNVVRRHGIPVGRGWRRGDSLQPVPVHPAGNLVPLGVHALHVRVIIFLLRLPSIRLPGAGTRRRPHEQPAARANGRARSRMAGRGSEERTGAGSTSTLGPDGTVAHPPSTINAATVVYLHT